MSNRTDDRDRKLVAGIASPSHGNHLIPIGDKTVEPIFYPEDPLSPATRNRLILDCHTSKDELCGLLDIQQGIYYIENTHEIAESNFFFDKEEYEIAVNEIFENNPGHDEPILGVWHTHPTNIPWPSPRDIRGWPAPALKWRYFIITNREVLEWRLL
jgi:proteasome lid subunit RPN8/RPN11